MPPLGRAGKPGSRSRRDVFALAILIALMVQPIDVDAHSLTDVDGSFWVGPPGARAGADGILRVTLKPLKPGATQGVKLRARLDAGGERAELALSPVGQDAHEGRFRVRDGFHDLRVYLDRPGSAQVAMAGFNVDPALAPATQPEGSALWFVPRGRFDAIRWLDNLAGALFAAAALGGIFVYRRRAHVAAAPAQAPSRPAALILAALGATAMPFGAFWDISFHAESGRETFFSPPHLLIYGGILLALLAVVAAIGRRSRPSSWRDHLARRRTAALAALALLVQLGSGPFDELWHSLFGFDVSVWSPPHAVLIGGGVLVCLALSSLPTSSDGRGTRAARVVTLAGAMLILEVFLAEFQYPFPEWHGSQRRPDALFPLMLAIFGGLVAGAARANLDGRWPALRVMLCYSGLRAVVWPFLGLLGRAATPQASLWLLVPLAIGLVVDLAAHRGSQIARAAHATAM